jgi:hypothetical protein
MLKYNIRMDKLWIFTQYLNKCIKSSVFWDVLATLCGPLNSNWRFGGGTCRLHIQGQSSKKPAITRLQLGADKLLRNVGWTKLPYIPENITLHNYCCENVESNKNNEQNIYNLIYKTLIKLFTFIILTLEQTQNQRSQTSVPWVGFEPIIPAFKKAKAVHA